MYYLLVDHWNQKPEVFESIGEVHKRYGGGEKYSRFIEMVEGKCEARYDFELFTIEGIEVRPMRRPNWKEYVDQR